MKVLENYSLRSLNTFGIDVRAHYFAPFERIEELQEITYSGLFKANSSMVLGGGSNVLFTKDYDGIVLKNNLRGIELVNEDENYYYVKAGAGENWHQFVLHCIEHNYAGVENLSLIPGNVGAGPLQNIGAYGVELKDVFYELEALHIADQTIHKFDNATCRFGYRDSIFKQEAKGQFIVLYVTIRLHKKPVYNISYGAIEKELEAMGVQTLSIKAISNAVCNIRRSKLPDPAKIGNAGSFFKNPMVTGEKFKSLQNEFPNIVGYPNDSGEVKLAAGWLIEQCGWKGKHFGDAGVHEKQALVLVNYGHAKGEEIYDLSQKILDSVNAKFGVQLEREVNII